jgi:hypothetical protein
MARRRKRRIIAGTKNVGGSLVVSSSDKKVEEHHACGGNRTSDGFCSSEVGGDKEKDVALLTDRSHSNKSGHEASRRNKMKDFFAVLHTFLPHLPPKVITKRKCSFISSIAPHIHIVSHV